MRQLWRVAVVVIILAVGTSSPPAAADPFDDAFNTYMSGDHKVAIRLMDSLGREGDVRAHYMMGRMYSEGEGVGQDDKLAAQWYQGAADRSDVVSQLSLGTLYVNGRGVNQNFVEAYKWFTLVALNNNRTAKGQALEVRDLITQLMTPDQVDEGERLAVSWRQK
ncbi:MAG: tetratricopeptide repeat protein [Alphaproteobacteria bacterium]